MDRCDRPRDDDMRVNVGCQGRFHLFELARQLERLGHLNRLYTGYPRFKVKGPPRAKVSTFPWLMAPYMGLGKMRKRALRSWEHAIHVTFDRWVASSLEPCDVYHCLTPVGLRTHQTAKSQYGALTVCDRPSTHILHQLQAMTDEFDRFGVALRPPDNRVVERQIAEYELCDLIFVPSESNRQTFIEHGIPATKVRRVPFGVNLDTFRPTAKKDDTFRVLFVGQIGLRKGIPYLFEAVAGLKLPKFELCLAGTVMPEGAKFLKTYEGSFRYLGVIPQQQLSETYSQASVLCIAINRRGTGIRTGRGHGVRSSGDRHHQHRSRRLVYRHG